MNREWRRGGSSFHMTWQPSFSLSFQGVYLGRHPSAGYFCGVQVVLCCIQVALTVLEPDYLWLPLGSRKLTFSFHKPKGSAGCRVALDLILQTSTCPEHSLQERFSRYSEGCPLSPPGGCVINSPGSICAWGWGLYVSSK